MEKQGVVNLNVNAVQSSKVATKIQFSSLDKNSAKLIFNVTKDGAPLPLSAARAILDLRMADWSTFSNLPVKIKDAAKGAMEYSLTAEQLKHTGMAQAELSVVYENGQSMSISKFEFKIDKALRDQDVVVKAQHYIKDIEDIKNHIQSIADDVEGLDVVQITSRLEELEQTLEDGAIGVDEQARQEIQEVTAQLADTVREVNGVKPTNGKVTLPIPEVDTSNLATKTDVQQLSLTFKESYETVSALNTKYPNGDNANHVVLTDNMIYTYKNGWVSTGIQANGTGIVNKTVTREKLNDSFSLYGNIASGADLKTLVNEGVYFGQPNGNYVNMPSDLNANRFFLLEVKVLSPVWAIQTIVDFTNPGAAWRKTIHRTNISGVNNAWEYGAAVKDGAVSRGKLADNFNNNGSLANGTDINTVTKPGVYLGVGGATSAYKNLPPEIAGKSFVMHVYTAGAVNTFFVQEITEIVDSSFMYRRLNTNSTTTGAWHKFKSEGSAGGGGSSFAGKTILMFGDSITENGDYPERVANYLGATVKKAGFGGCRMGQHTQTGNGLLYDKMCMHKLVDYIESGDFAPLTSAAEELVRANGDDNRTQANMLATLDFSKVDYITVFFGTNDFGSDDGVPIGSNSDTDGTTFKGAINKVIRKLSTSKPNIKLMFITPFYRNRLLSSTDGLNSDDNPNGRGVYLHQYVDAIKELCKKHHIPVLDLMEESGINRYNQATYLADGLHPTAPVGYELVARKIVSGLQERF